MAAFHSFFTADQYFIVYIPLLFIHSSVDGHLGCLHIFANLKNDAMNIRVHMTFQISVFIFFTCVPRNEILDHMVVLFFLSFVSTSILFSIVAVPIYILVNSVLGFPFLTSSPTLLIYCLLEDNYPNRCEMVSRCGFI